MQKRPLVERKDPLPILETINNREVPVYAMIFPAFNGQFTMDVTAGKLRSALSGWDSTEWLKLRWDILTLKEALNYYDDT